MGVEPTDACCSQPPTDFEDQGRHRATSTPAGYFRLIRYFSKLNKNPTDCGVYFLKQLLFGFKVEVKLKTECGNHNGYQGHDIAAIKAF